MIRPLTLITMILAALSGAYLFAVKHKAQVLDDQIAALSQSSREDAMKIRVLQGQWSMETDPTRLQQLAAQFTTLQPMKPVQLVTLASLGSDLPAAGSAVPASNPALPAQAIPQLAVAAVDAASGLPSPGALPLPPPPAPEPMVMASLAPPVVTRVVAHKVSHSVLHMANTAMAENMPAPKPYYAATPRPRAVEQMAQSRPVGPMGAQVMSVKATNAAQYMPPAASGESAGDGGSVLGMASNLAPPQPMPENGSDN